MSSRRVSWTRLAIILALSALMGSDSALAALICTQTMGCHATSSVQGEATPKSEELSPAPDSAVQSMPCCPGSNENAMQCADPAMGCCTLEQGSSQPAVVVSKSISGGATLDAALSATPAESLYPATGRFIEGWGTNTSLYVKPVNQKKTDLRI